MTRTAFCAFATALSFALPAFADDPPEADLELDTVSVFGRAISLLGSIESASSGVVGYEDFENRPLSRAGELVEVIPGVIATQHSGEGKGNQFFLRGFNLDHGTDFSIAVDGVPVNLRTHGHGQGYLDINFVIPELVERVDFRKGPYFADAGDFSAAGSARYKTYDTLEEGFAEVSIGENNFQRGVAASSFAIGDHSDLLLGLEAAAYDGPWVLEQDLTRFNGFAKLTHSHDSNHFHLIATAYDSEWTSTDQVPERAVDEGLIDRFGFIDDDLGGETTRFSVSGNASFEHAGGANTSWTAYAVAYDFRLFSNFTYFADDPVNGDEFEQRDRRIYYGGNVRHERALSERIGLSLGGEIRRDDIRDIGLFRTAARERLSTTRQDKVEQFSAGVYAIGDIELTDRLRAQIGLRGDYYDADVRSISLPENSGTESDTLVTPSASLIFQPNDTLGLFANYGRGFHSNDVRGATIQIDPVSGEAVDTVPILVEAEGAELGARVEVGRFNATAAVFWLDLESELVFVGDAGTTEVNDPTRRFGIETSAFWRATDWLVLDASAAFTDAEFDISGDETEIPGAVDTVFAAGAVVFQGPMTFSARVRHFGEAPLIEDGSVSSDATTVVNAAATYDWASVSLGLELLNVFDAEDSDITYFFESQLPGEAEPVADRHFHPVEPRQVRATLRYRF
ncbi:MAG: TonB-dependent receptor [Pseudomonadota bacterium]